MTDFFALFDTGIGPCGIAWSARGIAGVQLPEAGEQMTRERLRNRFPKAQETQRTGGVQHACEGIVALLRGRPSDFSMVQLDMDTVPPFHRRVYEAARSISWGTATTYGAIAEGIGAAGAARAVGQALARNPFAIIVPCHRVVSAGGRLGGFSAHGGIATKRWLLAAEGVQEPYASFLSAHEDRACAASSCG